MNLETISYNNERLAIILRNPYEVGVGKQEFISNNEDYLQVGIMNLEKGRILKPHVHKPRNEIVPYTQECLIIYRGRMKVDFYYKLKDKPEKVKETTLYAGDVIVLLSGGHGFEVLENTRLIEVKQGQYIDQKRDKEFIE
jgi:hypothetical protein